MTEPLETPRRRGRPRRAGVTDEIKAAARQLLMETGWNGFSIAEVARRTGVGKPTIYRRWPTRTALIHDALFSATDDAVPLPDTGLLRDDMITALIGFTTQFKSSGASDAARAVLAAEVTADRQDEIDAWAERHARDRSVVVEGIARGQRRGDPAPAVAPDLLADVFINWIVHECVVKQDPPSPERITDMVEAVLGYRSILTSEGDPGGDVSS